MDRIGFGARHSDSRVHFTICTRRYDRSAVYCGGLELFAAALGALAWRPDRLAVPSAAVVGIILATLTKSVGIALVVPAKLSLIRFLP